MSQNPVSADRVAPAEASTQRPSPTMTPEFSIHMVDVEQACQALSASRSELLALVNDAELAAYRLGDQLRFRYRDVDSLASRRAIAA